MLFLGYFVFVVGFLSLFYLAALGVEALRRMRA